MSKKITIYGFNGTEKIHIAIGLGVKACLAGYRVLFTSIPHLINQLKECRSEKTLTSFN